MPHINPIVLAQALTVESDVQKLALGTTVQDERGNTYTYVQAASQLDKYGAASILGDGTAIALTTTAAASSKRIGIPQLTLTSGYYGWVQTAGKALVKLAANCAPNVPLYTTATAGVLDDAVVSQGLVLGTVAETSISNATAVTVTMAQGAMIGSGDMD